MSSLPARQKKEWFATKDNAANRLNISINFILIFSSVFVPDVIHNLICNCKFLDKKEKKGRKKDFKSNDLRKGIEARKGRKL